MDILLGILLFQLFVLYAVGASGIGSKKSHSYEPKKREHLTFAERQKRRQERKEMREDIQRILRDRT